MTKTSPLFNFYAPKKRLACCIKCCKCRKFKTHFPIFVPRVSANLFCFESTCFNNNAVIYDVATMYADVVVTNFSCNGASESIEEVVRRVLSKLTNSHRLSRIGRSSLIDRRKFLEIPRWFSCQR